MAGLIHPVDEVADWFGWRRRLIRPCKHLSDQRERVVKIGMRIKIRDTRPR